MDRSQIPQRWAARASAAALTLLLCACTQPQDSPETETEPTPQAATPEAAGQAQGMSLLGEPLVAPEPAEDFRHLQESLLEAAQAELDSSQANGTDLVEPWIWVGRRTAYLGRYREAIDIYSQALEQHPAEPRLLRHRGHRWLTVRELAKAAADLEQAAELSAGQPDRIEPDGLPNAAGIPTSTLQSNIWYHLGLARYAMGDFPEAVETYQRGMEVSSTDDMRVATAYWLYLALARAGKTEEAQLVLEPWRADLELLENRNYLELLLLFRGEVDPEALWQRAQEKAGLEMATLGYGLGAYRLLQGEAAAAREIFEQVLAGGRWAAFGHLAAEAELARDQ